MKVGLIGFGDHVERNILPAFASVEGLEVKRAFVRQKGAYAQKADKYNISLEMDLNNFLNEEDVDLIYVVTPIPKHLTYVKKALEAGKHVWCEKAFGTSFEDTLSLVQLAREKKLQLCECLMYVHHPQFQYLLKLVGELDQSAIHSVKTRFSVPTLSESSSHYRLSESGGAFLDQGIYPMSIALELFGWPKKIKSNYETDEKTDVNCEGDVIFSYENFDCFVSWSQASDYSNFLKLEHDKGYINVERAFSKPSNYESTIVGPLLPSGKKIFSPADHFANMFKAFIDNQTTENFNQKMRQRILEYALVQHYVQKNEFPFKADDLIGAQEKVKKWSLS